MTNYLPNPADGTSGQVPKVQTDGSLAYAADQTASGGTTADSEELGTNGDIVWIGDGDNGVIDVSGTSTPVQDAIDNIGALSNNGGVIWLPPGVTQDTGPLTDFAKISIIGTGIGRSLSGEHNCTLEINGSGNDGIFVQDYHDATWAYLHNFTLKAHDQTDGRAAMRFDGEYKPRNFNIGVLRLHNWTNTSSATGTQGVICFDGDHPFSSQWNFLSFFDTDGPGIYSNFGGLAINIGSFYFDPRNGSGTQVPVRVENGSPRFRIGILNIDTYSDMALDLNPMLANGHLEVAYLNYEPTQLASSTEAVHHSGRGSLVIHRMDVTGTDVDQFINMDGNANARIGRLRTVGGNTVSNAKINCTASALGTSYYFGSTSDVANNTGDSGTGVQCLDTAGTEAT